MLRASFCIQSAANAKPALLPIRDLKKAQYFGNWRFSPCLVDRNSTIDPSNLMKLKHTAILAVAALSVLATTTSQASSRTLVQQSHQLEAIVGELRTEFREHYDHTSIYRHMTNDAAKIEREAGHLHQLAHNYFTSLSHILRDLEEIDELAHHLHKMVDAADTGRSGHVHGSTQHVHKLLDKLNAVIHNMERTVRYDASHGQGHGGGHDDDHGHGGGGHDDHDDHAGHGHKVEVQDIRKVIRGIIFNR